MEIVSTIVTLIELAKLAGFALDAGSAVLDAASALLK